MILENNSNKENKINDNKISLWSYRITSIVIILAILLFTSRTVGSSDLLTFLLLIIVWLLIFSYVNDIRQNLRHMLMVVGNEDSLVRGFFSKRSILIGTTSFVGALFVSISFLVTLKILTIKHGLIVTLLALILPTFFTYTIGRDTAKIISEQISSKEGRVAVDKLIKVAIRASILTVITAVIFSMLDTVSFYLNKINFFDFSTVAEQQAIPWSESGKYTRLPINFMIIVSSFESASINEFVVAIGVSKDSLSPLYYWLISLFFNILKLLPFSIAYYFIVLSIRDSTEKFYGPVKFRLLGIATKLNLKNKSIKK